MTFQITNQHSENLQTLIRRIGYKPIGYSDKGELNCVRPLGSDYPRFHLYITEAKEANKFSLHLDQKRPSYEGSTAHSGDYDTDIVRDEARRIQTALSSAKSAGKKSSFLIAPREKK